MKQLVAILATIIVAAAIYTAVALLTSPSLSQPGMLPILAGVTAGAIVSGILGLRGRPKA